MSCAETKERMALLCGDGPFPVMVARAAAAKGVEVLALGWKGKVDKGLDAHAAGIHLYPFGLIEGMIETLAREKIKKAMLAGKFDKNWIYQGGVEVDDTGREFLKRLKDHSDDSMLAIVGEILKERGIDVVENSMYIKDWLAPAGVLTGSPPTEAEEKDMEFGLKIIRELGKLGIGQSVVVKHGNVVAVEAMEHTDETIKRAGIIAGGGSVVVKAARPDQDLRWDVPVVGLETLQSMQEAGARVLAVEAGKTLLIDREKFIEEADRLGLCVKGVEAG